MNFIRKVIGPKSKYDKTIPYAYFAKVYLLDDDQSLCRYFYGDTICSLIEHLDNEGFEPKEVKLFGLFRGDEISIDLKYCTSSSGEWLTRPDLCRALENQYLESLDKIYKGHVEIGECCFEDRDDLIL